jgi:hypothetical protein
MAKKTPPSNIKAPAPDAPARPAATPVQAISRGLTDRFVNDAVNDPVAILDRANTITDVCMNLAPTLPGEFPIPIPRGIYERIKDIPQVKQLQQGGQTNAGQK